MSRIVLTEQEIAGLHLPEHYLQKLNEEIETYNKYLLPRYLAAEKAGNELNKILTIGPIFSYLNDERTTQLLKIDAFRKEIKGYISSFYAKAHEKEVPRRLFDAWDNYLEEPTLLLCQKIGEIEGTPLSIAGCAPASAFPAASAASAFSASSAASATATEAASTVVPPPVAPTAKVLGSGSYGAVIKPALSNRTNGTVHEYPENVTKLFFKQKAYNKIVRNRPTIKRIFDDEGHRMNTYTVQRTFKNLPKSLRTNIETRSKQTYKENVPLYALRMPDLGKDISDIADVYKEVRMRPVVDMLDQFVKLLRQVNNEVKAGYIHGDIRDMNVMIQPSTGVLTIVDFDKFETKDKFAETYAFGFYNNPPECLCVDDDGKFQPNEDNEDNDEDNDEDSDENENDDENENEEEENGDPSLRYAGGDPTEARLNRYVSSFYKQFDFITQMFKKEGDLKEAIKAANKLNSEHFKKNGIVSVQSGDTWKMFDAFGLACTLLTLFNQVYLPQSFLESTPDKLEEWKKSLSTRITNNGVPYKEPDLTACTTAIRSMATTVLLPLAKFRYTERIPIQTALERAEGIRAKLRAHRVDLMSNNTPSNTANLPLTAEEARIKVLDPISKNKSTNEKNLENIFGNERVRKELERFRMEANATRKSKEGNQKNPISTAFQNLVGGRRFTKRVKRTRRHRNRR